MAGKRSGGCLGIVLLLAFGVWWMGTQDPQQVPRIAAPQPQTFGELAYGNPPEGTMLPIGRALTANQVRGCGEYYVNTRGSSEYAIKCSRDGQSWTYWLVFTAIEKVQGPFSADDEIP